ncbi:MAG TPA: Crp/Fnr family transcriptional regulator [Vicinamibacterales bacterium]|jgi:CRP-like cAMP-binding protein
MHPFSRHPVCLALGSVLKGTLCERVFGADLRQFSKGDHVFRPGDRANALHRVVSGLIGISSPAPDGDDVMLRLAGPDEVFGELCFCGDAQKHLATALEPTTIVSAPADRVIAALRERPELALDLIRLLSERLASAYADVQAATGDRLVTRLARKLVELCVVDQGDGWYRLAHRLTHDELAQLLGVQRESLTRAMIDLRALGLIDYSAHMPVKVALGAVHRFIATERAGDGAVKPA